MGGSVWWVRDELWEVSWFCRRPDRSGWASACDDRVAFNAVVYVLMTGIAWQFCHVSLAARRRLRIAGCRSGSVRVCGLRCTGSAAPVERGGADRLVGRSGGWQSCACSSRGL